eukprot:178698-Pyramimonas_sp.AAC.1
MATLLPCKTVRSWTHTRTNIYYVHSSTKGAPRSPEKALRGPQDRAPGGPKRLSLIHISEPTRPEPI